jgi:hypothetical protein|tara:strand:- start:4393 stop:4875 length:483 start_codon:yes stop_codon:yes gene_type:complete
MIDDHEFSDAYYINNERTTLKTEWIDNKDKSILRPYIIEVDKDPEIYKKFLEMVGVSEDWLNERTWERIKLQRENYELEVLEIAKRNNDFVQVVNQNDSKEFIEGLYKYLNKPMSSKDLFTFKLSLFEHESVQKSKKKKVKSGIRTANSAKEAFKLFLEI